VKKRKTFFLSKYTVDRLWQKNGGLKNIDTVSPREKRLFAKVEKLFKKKAKTFDPIFCCCPFSTHV
jgi:hypothetical protein